MSNMSIFEVLSLIAFAVIIILMTSIFSILTKIMGDISKSVTESSITNHRCWKIYEGFKIFLKEQYGTDLEAYCDKSKSEIEKIVNTPPVGGAYENSRIKSGNRKPESGDDKSN